MVGEVATAADSMMVRAGYAKSCFKCSVLSSRPVCTVPVAAAGTAAALEAGVASPSQGMGWGGVGVEGDEDAATTVCTGL
jgi:hypothetical protein